MRALTFDWHSLWRPRRPGPITFIGIGVDWPNETQAGDLALLLIESDVPFEPPKGWAQVSVNPAQRMYWRIVGFARRALHLPPGRGVLAVFRNASLL